MLADLENVKREDVDEEGHEPNGGDGLHGDVELQDGEDGCGGDGGCSAVHM